MNSFLKLYTENISASHILNIFSSFSRKIGFTDLYNYKIIHLDEQQITKELLRRKF